MKSVRVLDTRDKRELQTDIDGLLTMKANRTELPTTASQVNADVKGTANGKVNEHNASPSSHHDIRMAIKETNDRLDAVEESVGGLGHMKIGDYSFITNSDGHLTLVYTG